MESGPCPGRYESCRISCGQMDVLVLVPRKGFDPPLPLREAAQVSGLHRNTVRKMLKHSLPPGYLREQRPRRPKLDPYKGVIDEILEHDHSLPSKQRHTAKRIYERFRDEHGFAGKCTIVKDYVRERRRQTREMFVPLAHPAGHAQCDFGEAWVIIGVESSRRLTTAPWTFLTAMRAM